MLDFEQEGLEIVSLFCAEQRVKIQEPSPKQRAKSTLLFALRTSFSPFGPTFQSLFLRWLGGLVDRGTG